MDAGTLGVMIPIIALMIPFFAIWTKHKEKVATMQIETTANSTAEKAAQYSSQVTELEDRVRVLERIVTDRGYDVATQIEALRDQRTVDGADSGTPLNIAKGERV
jgi:hypothetical protein